MSSVYNQVELKGRRRGLRKNQTDAEAAMWQLVGNRRFLGLKFFRQYSAGNYILDFYCPELRIALEIDGGQHSEEASRQYDEQRTQHLNEQNITVVRYWNNEVLTNIDGVCDHLSAYIKPHLTSPYIKGRNQASHVY